MEKIGGGEGREELKHDGWEVACCLKSDHLQVRRGNLASCLSVQLAQGGVAPALSGLCQFECNNNM